MSVLVHLILSIFMFFGINALGHFTPSNFGYYQLTTFLETDEAPAFNYLIRVLTPIVLLILISTLFYSLGWDFLVTNIYLVNVYYVGFRIAFNLIIRRELLVNWKRQIIYAISIMVLSYFMYEKLIKIKTNLLPDFNNIANELWVIIFIFLYNLINNLQYSDDKAQKRKDSYLRNRFLKFKSEYGCLINARLNQKQLAPYIYAIMIYEDFNRPKLFRLIEYLRFFLFKKPLTLGIMQISTNKFIGDKDSILVAIEILEKRYEELQLEFNTLDEIYENEWDKAYRQTEFLEKLLVTYNIRSDYASEIEMIVKSIREQGSLEATDLFSKSVV